MIFISVKLIILTSFFQPLIKVDDYSLDRVNKVVLFDNILVEKPDTYIVSSVKRNNYNTYNTRQMQCLAYYSGKEIEFG